MLIKPDQTVYIYAPHSFASGGPELLHQLGSELEKNGKEVKMVYFPKEKGNPVHENYVEYGLEWLYEAPDESDSIVILPEVMADLHKRFKNATVVIWWLSIDFYYLSSMNLFKKILNQLGQRVFDQHLNAGFDHSLITKGRLHLYQSEYARQHLEGKGVQHQKLFRLSDYLHPLFLNEAYDSDKKENIVAYNPNKGIKFTRKLIKANPQIQFVPIENMSRSEVIDLLKRAKVYIDFGFHPGKDRIPREAAYLGCCVIVGKRGSARNGQDVPISEEYKYPYLLSSDNFEQISRQIQHCFSNYSECQAGFKEYINIIMNEKHIFEQEVLSLFKVE